MKLLKIITASLVITLLVFANSPWSHAQVSAIGDRSQDRDMPISTIPQVTGVEVKKIKVHQIKLGWNSVPLAQRYEIKVMQGGEVVKTVTSITANKTIKSLKSGTTYQFQVRAQVSNNYGEYSTVLATQTKAKLSKNNNDIIDNELIIEVKKHKKLDTPYPYERLKISKYTKNNFIYLKINDNTPSDEVIDTLEKLPGVISIEYNGIYEFDTVVPNDEYYSDNPSKATYGWQHLGNYQYGGEDGIATFNNEAWDHQTGSADIVIAVIDSGIDTDNPDLQGNIWVNSDEIAGNGLDDDNNGFIDDINGWDFGNNEADPNPNLDGVDDDGDGTIDDSAGHGSSVDGSLAPVGDNITGVVGPMWDASIMALQTNTNADYGPNNTAVVNAISYAIANGADIINMSFSSANNYSSLSSAVSAAADAGIFLVASAGNDPNMDLNVTPRYPICYERVFGVSGYSLAGQVPYFTYGSNCVDLIAPAENIKTTSIDTSTGQPTYVNIAGTSFATPIVSGIAGLMLSEKNTLTRQEITNILIATVTKQENITEDYGAGLVNGGAALAGVNCLNSDASVKTVNTYYADVDGDGYGAKDIEYSCSTSTPAGASTNDTDCNDTDSQVNATQTYYKDADGDGLGTSSTTTKACSNTPPSGYVSNSSDKNDSDFDNDGVSTSSDCNDKDTTLTKGNTYYKDADGDGLGDPNTTTQSCSQPSGYATNSSDKNDNDYDNDGISNGYGDCNDKDVSVGYATTYYKDADGDGLGSSNTNTTTKACSQPSGYVTNSSDKNDSDYDNDGTSTSSDCNDKDNTVSSNKTYYQDADGDGLGDPNKTTTVCSATVPTGYVTNGNDTNDTVNSANVETGDDSVDNDSDGTVDETNTTDENGYNPTYASNDPASTEQYAASVTEIVGTINGAIIVTFTDNSQYTYPIFDISTDKKTKVKSVNGAGYLVVLHPKANNLALVNVYTGQIYETQKLSDSNWSGKTLKLKDLLDDSKTEAVIVATQDANVLTVIVRVNPDKDDKLKKKDSLKVTNNLVEAKKTNVKKNTIELRDENEVVLETLKVDEEYQMTVQ